MYVFGEPHWPPVLRETYSGGADVKSKSSLRVMHMLRAFIETLVSRRDGNCMLQVSVSYLEALEWL